jgi:hypothetical protein
MTGSRPQEEVNPSPPLPHGELDEPLDGAPSPEIEAIRAAEPREPPGDLKRKTATSILWTVVRTGSDHFLSFLIFAVLARKLGPAAFGVFALAAAFAEFGKILPSSGLASGRCPHSPAYRTTCPPSGRRTSASSA